ncbi:Acyl-CoA-binding domain-containing protein 5-B [Bagarius yarrelli]|uniref:Acyl-CoA-binding domain-containing protein 5-B n=1 Tax=Bagarius yarrelli TaxID=175774 RepID=A0A556TZU2_BAGYA|nr:Acyl-CoA-binding domain-containing protein 5-B [Bagarius yarrelli]
MLIRFYSFHQQATAGVCNSSKPCSHDALSTAKWEAWRALGDMSKEEAMQAYVKEILLILEMIPVTEEVSDLLEVLEPFYEVVEDDDEDGDDGTSCKPVMTESSESSDERREKSAGNSDDDMEDNEDNSKGNNDVREAGSPYDESVSTVYCYIECSESLRADAARIKRQENREGNTKDVSVSQDEEPQGDAPPPLSTKAHGAVQSVILSGERGRGELVPCYRNVQHVSREHIGVDPVNTQIVLVLSRLQDDMRNVVARLAVLEARAMAQTISQSSVVFLFVWPFVVHVLVQLYLKKKRFALHTSLLTKIVCIKSQLTCVASSPTDRSESESKL